MKLSCHRLELPLEHTFTIARGSITSQHSVVVQLEHEGHSGWGEVTENSFYGHTVDSIVAAIESVRPAVERVDELTSELATGDFWNLIADALSPNTFAISALDMAFCDLSSRLRGIPAYRLWGLDTEHPLPPSSFTIGIDDVEIMRAKLRERLGWSIYKIKLGTDQDLSIVRSLRQESDAVFRVDANCGWTADQTIEYSHELKSLNVEFIEQPLPIDACDSDKQRVREQSVLPIIADEDCQVESDVQRCLPFYHGINIKLCKCGGLTPAVRMLRQARSIGLSTMVGCMVESSIGISATAQLLPMLDHADLDGALLLGQDPATGVTIDHGIVQFCDTWGTGASLQGSGN